MGEQAMMGFYTRLARWLEGQEELVVAPLEMK